MHLASMVGKSLLSMVRSQISKNVIERWSRYRADQFVEALIDAVREERDYDISEDELNRLLTEITEDDAKSEAVF